MVARFDNRRGVGLDRLEEMRMKAKLLIDVPVDPKHGMKKGRILDVIRQEGRRRGLYPAWVMGADGVEVRIHGHEYEVVPEPPLTDPRK